MSLINDIPTVEVLICRATVISVDQARPADMPLRDHAIRLEQ
ncbi:MAG: hypothetical protein QOD36_3733 [Mycobacterium sp.]|jgi:hypothetical protein|nr:hypothetical protein [Mycobacterium sp.]